MCVMEVHPGQHVSSMAIAMAHNTHTVLGDLDLLQQVLRNRGDDECVRSIERAREKLEACYAIFLTEFGYEVAHSVADQDGRLPQQVGNERSLVAEADREAKKARRYETR